MIDGILNINKPEDWTSHDVVAKLKGALRVRKIGHTGTLDPMATGVLPICIGKATRMTEYYDDDLKTYEAELQLGVITDTLDSTGEVLETRPFDDITEEALRKAAADYSGWIDQIPPKYSAIWINGRRAYDLARAGEAVDIKPRRIYVAKTELTSLDLASGKAELEIVCSKGTYIRTICDDIGRALGCGASMTRLVRTRSGVFGIENAINLAKAVELGPEAAAYVVPVDETLVRLGKAVMTDERVRYFLNGNETGRIGYRILEEPQVVRMDRFYRVYDGAGNFLGTGTIDGRGELKAHKVTVER